MSEEIVYIDYDEALTIYGKMIDASAVSYTHLTLPTT